MSRQLEIKPPVENKPPIETRPQGVVEKTAGGCLYLAISFFNLRDTIQRLVSKNKDKGIQTEEVPGVQPELHYDVELLKGEVDEIMVDDLIAKLEKFCRELGSHQQGTFQEKPVSSVPTLIGMQEVRLDLLMLGCKVIQLVKTGSSKYEEALKVVRSFEQRYLDAGATEFEFMPIKAECDEVRGWIYLIASGAKDSSTVDLTYLLAQALRYFLDSQSTQVDNLFEDDPTLVEQIQKITYALAIETHNERLEDLAAQLNLLWD